MKLAKNRTMGNIDWKRFLFKQLPTSIFFFCFLRYVFFSDSPPDRTFPASFRPETCDNCFPSDFQRIVNPPTELCKKGGKVDVVILITTVPSAVEARQAIRQTWGKRNHTKTAIFLFLFGSGYSPEEQKVIQTEASQHSDILQEDFKDNYYNLSLKVIMGYKWAMQSCPQVAFIARSADDNYINVPALIDLIHTRGNELQTTMFGDCENYALPWRWPFHKWAISLKEYHSILFPPYCIGTTFVTSLKMAADLVDISPHVPFFPIEDVYFGMVVKQLGGSYGVRTLKGFNLASRSASGVLRQCPYPDPMYTIHPLTPHQIRRTWSMCQFGMEKT